MRSHAPVILHKEGQVVGRKRVGCRTYLLCEAVKAREGACHRGVTQRADVTEAVGGGDVVADVVGASVVGVRAGSAEQIVLNIIDVVDVRAERQKVSAVAPGNGVRKLVAHFLRKCGPIEEVGLPEDKVTDTIDSDLRRRTLCRDGFAGNWRLCELVFKIAANLVTEFVGDGVGKRGSKTRDAPIFLDEVVTKALEAAIDDAGSLNSGRRSPAQAIVGERGVVL